MARTIVHPPGDVPTGAEVRAARTAAGMTLTQLAIDMGVNPTKLSRLERGIEQNTQRTRQALDRLAGLRVPNVRLVSACP